MRTVPNVAISSVLATVATTGRNRQRATTPTAKPASPSHMLVPRPSHRDSAGKTAPPTSAPAARATECRPATALPTPCSSRSSGTTGAKPYRK
jgi:hypothetical protein